MATTRRPAADATAPRSGGDRSGAAGPPSVEVGTTTPPSDVAVLEALELPLNGPRQFWLGFVFAADRRLAARAHELTGELVAGRGRTLETFAATGAGDVERSARAIVEHERTESPVWVDWSRLGASVPEREAVDRALTMLNVGRTRLIKALGGWPRHRRTAVGRGEPRPGRGRPVVRKRVRAAPAARAGEHRRSAC